MLLLVSVDLIRVNILQYHFCNVSGFKICDDKYYSDSKIDSAKKEAQTIKLHVLRTIARA